MEGAAGPRRAPDVYSPINDELELLSGTLKSLAEKYRRAKEAGRIVDVRKLGEDIHDVREMLQMINDEM
jgi:hypothetical protein